MDTAFITKTTRQLTSWRFWLYGLVSGFLGGGATAAMSAGGLATAHASGFDVPVLNLKAVGVVFLSAGLTSAFAYLSKSPLPPLSQNQNP